MRLLTRALLAVVFLGVSTTAHAQVRTWVATFGVDNATCTRSSPCRTFAAAITAVAAGGEVVVLDSGGYGQVTINKSVTLLSPRGIHAAIAPTAGAAVTINAAGAVAIHNLFVNAQGADQGIAIISAGIVTIEDCVVNGFLDEGIFHSEGALLLSNTMVRNSTQGLFMDDSSRATIVNCRFVNNAVNGVTVAAGSQAVIRESVASGNMKGFVATQASSLVLESSVAAYNGNGVEANNATATVSNSTLAYNGNGLVRSGTSGAILSRGNNAFFGNGDDEDGIGPVSYVSARSNALKLDYFDIQEIAGTNGQTRTVPRFVELNGPGIDTVFEVLNTGGRAGQPDQGPFTVTVYLFEEDGSGMTALGGPVCPIGCVYMVSTATPIVRIKVEDIILAAGGFVSDELSGFAMITVFGGSSNSVHMTGLVEMR